jgi:phenylalanyl-tRNA synthetase beta chain
MKFRVKDIENYLSKKLDWKKIEKILTFNTAEASLKDDVLEIDILPNRSPDLNSFIGLAKEVSIFSKVKFKEPKINSIKAKVKINNNLVKNKIPKLVPYYFGAYVVDVKMKKSPLWLEEILKFYEIQPQNILVDLANFVMLEYNAPLHIFDFDKLDDQIQIRLARRGEKFEDLKGREYRLDGDIVIADDKDIIALGGIVGGNKAKVDESTRNIFIEAAVFDSYSIRKTMKKLNLTTEAGLRFSKRVAPIRSFLALHRLVDLIERYSYGKLKSKVILGKIPEAKEIKFSPQNFYKLIGIDLKEKEILKMLKLLGCNVRLIKDNFLVKVPQDRLDLESEVDLIEEILRLYSYEKIKGEPELSFFAFKDPSWSHKKELIDILLRLGFQETYSYSFPLKKYTGYFEECLKNDEEEILAKNPISEERPSYRFSLYPSLFESIYELQFQQNFGKVFKIGRIAFLKNNKIIEKEKVCLGVFGRDEKNIFQELINGIKYLSNVFNYEIDFKLNPSKVFGDAGRSIFINGQEIGTIGMVLPHILKKLDFDVFIGLCDLDLEIFLEKRKLKFVPFPETPSTYRDLSFWIDPQVNFSEIKNFLKGLSIKILEDFSLIDLYYKDKRKSMTIRFIFRDPEKSLRSEEIDEVFEIIKNSLKEKFKIEER